MKKIEVLIWMSLSIIMSTITDGGYQAYWTGLVLIFTIIYLSKI